MSKELNIQTLVNESKKLGVDANQFLEYLLRKHTNSELKETHQGHWNFQNRRCFIKGRNF